MQIEPGHIDEIPGGPEQLFGLHDATYDFESVRLAMRTSDNFVGPSGQIPLGTLGTAVDFALGFALIMHRPEDHWSVSVEITIDGHAPIPRSGLLVATGHAVHHDEHGAFAVGEVRTEAGDLIATASQRGRYIHAPGRQGGGRNQVEIPDDADLVALLGIDLDTGQMLVQPHLGNPLGNLHGGVSLAAVDLVAEHVIASGLRTQSIHLTYPRSAPLGSTIEYLAQVEHRGRSLATAAITGTVAGRITNLARVTQA
ncbi:MAG TPA: hotdog domain-containing protein [Marmoricola sp.]|nr:hotdog domain-containing protein [Marmoricola sp.]HNJ77943.1 hotdog domain-containing protein [Marmoricola sp.]HNN47373.1 hotdog domain-containing protein [Marmoricola sp.]HNO39751.1 hotdog domain-containing protein [Marmoricola sp.]